MAKQIIILLLTLLSVNCIYDDVYDCTQYYTPEDQAKMLSFDDIDKYIFLLGAPIAFFCTWFIMITFLLYPKTRRMPGDIIFCISLSDSILSVHWFLFAIYNIKYGESPLSDGSFCQVNAFLSIMAGTGEFIYNVAFCIYLRIKITEVLKIKTKLRLILHILCVSIVILVPLIAKLTGKTGLSLYGTCSFKQGGGLPVAGLVLLGIYILVSVYTICFFQKHVPDNQTFQKQKKDFLKYYFNYICASCIIWSVLAFSNLLSGFNCEYFHRQWLDWAITLGNAAKLATPIVLSILRYHDPTIRKKIMRVFSRVFVRNSRSESHLSSGSQDDNWLGQISSNLKFHVVVTILQGIRQYYHPHENIPGKRSLDVEEDQILLERLISSHEKCMTRYNLTKNDFQEQLILQLKPDEKIQSLSMTMTVYAPKVFSLLQQKHEKMVNPFVSFDIQSNEAQIQSFKGPDGGKSGEFFFFTSDNSLILKTLTDGELKALKSRLASYSTHLLDQDSMISIIYGVFTFERKELIKIGNLKYNIVLMRNIGQVPSKYRLRCYDLKGNRKMYLLYLGSEFDREVLKRQNSLNTSDSEIDLSKLTLKDTDFFKLEKNVQIDPILSERIKKILYYDANYFKQSKLIDYSLLIFKINWGQFIKDHSINIQRVLDKFSSELNIIPSITEPGVYYHIAIIDYLQEWNAQKLMEKRGKQLINRDLHLDTSAQDPDTYAVRFMENLVAKIF